jgi:hypothetical protein
VCTKFDEEAVLDDLHSRSCFQKNRTFKQGIASRACFQNTGACACTKFDEEAVLDPVSVGKRTFIQGPVSEITGPSSKELLQGPVSKIPGPSCPASTIDGPGFGLYITTRVLFRIFLMFDSPVLGLLRRK